jgi:mannose-6-phosphate isomerase-like protein (cupin superfamily)
MSSDTPYSIDLNTRFGPLEQIDVRALAAACTETWWNQTLTRVNDCVIRLGVVHGEFHWHKHDEEDEFFYVVEGTFIVELEERTIELHPGQGVTVPRGVLHTTRAPERTVILMMEGSGVIPTGD